MHLSIDSAIHAVVTDRIERAVRHAEELEANALVVQLDTPGGSLEATRQIVKVLLGSSVPVVVWVGPAGSRAASAGFILLLAADVAAMAPGTHTGAAHPVAQGGQDIEGSMGEKVKQDLLALVRSLATQGHRDLELAQSAVGESLAFTAEEAVEHGLVDVLAGDLEELLRVVDGRTMRREPALASGALRTRGGQILNLEMGLANRMLAALAHPQIAGLLLALGMLGLYAEISNPGTLVPGVLGAICLILAFYALSVLPVNHAGLALIGLALLFFVGELMAPTFGILTLGGGVSLVLGLLMTFRDAGPEFRVPTWQLVVAGVVVFLTMGFISRRTLMMRKQTATTGRDGMIGLQGSVVSARESGDLRVRVRGELWQARLAETQLAPRTPGTGAPALETGQSIEIIDVDGLTLRVAPVSQAHDSYSRSTT
ncbi:MAG: nodulation protein NfeD [Thermoanaerobaculia bacterium]|nr:nodulation protein NfeD [Thermoanaerobaculia bacterium]